MVKWWGLIVAFLVGVVACGALVLYLSYSEGAKLSADLSASRTSLDSASASNRRLAESNAILLEQRKRANEDAASEHAQLAKRDAVIAGQQRIIDGQQRDLDAIKLGLDAIAGSFAGFFGDLQSRAKQIADGFAKLYSIYHPGAG